MVDDLGPAVEQHSDCRVLVGTVVCLDVRDQALGVGLGVAPKTPSLATEVVLASGDGIFAGVHARAKAGAQRLDRPPGHGQKVGPSRTDMPQLMPAQEDKGSAEG